MIVATENRVPDSNTAYILLATVPAVDTLALSEFGENGAPYESTLEGFDRSDGRSLQGLVRVMGNLYAPKRIWRLQFFVDRPQLVLFEQILTAQKSGVAVNLVDNWVGVGTANASGGQANDVFVDVDDRYAAPINGSWYLLQFVARAI